MASCLKVSIVDRSLAPPSGRWSTLESAEEWGSFGVIVCSVGVRPHSITTKTTSTTIGGNAARLQLVVRIRMPQKPRLTPEYVTDTGTDRRVSITTSMHVPRLHPNPDCKVAVEKIVAPPVAALVKACNSQS